LKIEKNWVIKKAMEEKILQISEKGTVYMLNNSVTFAG